MPSVENLKSEFASLRNLDVDWFRPCQKSAYLYSNVVERVLVTLDPFLRGIPRHNSFPNDADVERLAHALPTMGVVRMASSSAPLAGKHTYPLVLDTIVFHTDSSSQDTTNLTSHTTRAPST